MSNTNKKELLTVYLLIGKDKLKINTVLDKLQERMNEFGDMSFNSNKFNGQTADAEQIIQACLQIPFNSDKKYVLVQDADKLSADSKNKITEYLDNPNETTVLAMVFEKLAKTTRLYKASEKISKLSIIDCTPPKKYEIPNSLNSIARKYQGQIQLNAAKKLVELVGDDTQKLDSEIQKLLLSSKNKVITLEQVNAEVKKSSSAKPWDFTNAFGDKDVDKCLKIYWDMPKSSEFQLLFQINKLLKELICVKDLSEKANLKSLSNELHCEEWKLKNHIKWANNFEKEEIIEILNKALECDKKMKSSSNAHLHFETFIVSSLSNKKN